MARYIGEDEYDVKQYLNSVITTSEEPEEEIVDDMYLGVLQDMLIKMFELAGADISIDDLSNMSEFEQTQLWSKYKLSEEQYAEWYDFYIDNCDRIFDEPVPEETVKTVFENIVNTWGFDVEFSEKTKQDVVETFRINK